MHLFAKPDEEFYLLTINKTLNQNVNKGRNISICLR